MHSSRTTTTGAITRASTISPRPTSTSGAVKPSCWKEKGSNARPSKTVGCFTTNKPRNINHDAPDSLLVHAASCIKISDDGQLLMDNVACKHALAEVQRAMDLNDLSLAPTGFRVFVINS